MQQRGFTLVELLIALVLSSVLLLGVTATYSALRTSMSHVDALTSAQEVLRSVHATLSRSLRSAATASVDNNALVVQQANAHGDTKDCLGRVQLQPFSERFEWQQQVFYCQVNNEARVAIVQGIEAIQFISGAPIIGSTVPSSIQVHIAPTGLPASYPLRLQQHPALRLDFALKTAILTWAT